MEITFNDFTFNIKEINDLKVDSKLVKMIEEAIEKDLNKLFEEHKETFYCFTLNTSGEAFSVSFTAYSKEVLEKLVSKELKRNPEIDIEKEMHCLKWSYADSPYSLYCYDEYFSHISDYIFNKREKLKTERQIDNHIEKVLNSMEKAMYNIDSKSKFSNGQQRSNIIINVEFIPPDYTNVERALRLNSIDTILSTNYIEALEFEYFQEYLEEINN